MGLFVWFLTMAREYVSIYQHVIAYYHIPKHRKHTRFVATEEGLKIKYISYSRLWFVFFVIALRLVIASSLLYSGSVWLCKTFSVPDLVLNGAALAFILDIDDIIFQTIVPKGAHNLVSNIEPIELGEPWIWHGLGGRWIPLVGSFAFVVFMAYDELIPFKQKLDDIMRYMCAGEQNFFFDQLTDGTLVFTDTESWFKQEGDLSARIDVTAKIGDWADEWEHLQELQAES